MTEAQPTGQALSMLHMVVATRELLFRVAELPFGESVEDQVLRANAWQSVNGRFQLVVSMLTDPEYLDANEDLLTEYGLDGPEIEYRRRQFDQAIARPESGIEIVHALRTGESILRSLSGMPSIGPTVLAIAAYIAAVRESALLTP